MRYVAPFLIIAAAASLRFGLSGLIGPAVPFILFFPAVTVSAWLGGLAPGLLATLLGAIVSHVMFFTPEGLRPRVGFSEALQILLFVLASVLISLLCESLHRARDEAEASSGRAAFLAEASAVLASSLDYETTLRSIARMAVPCFADWCSVDVLEGDGSINRLAVAHADPAKEDVARVIARYPPDPGGRHPRTAVLQTGRSAFIADIDDDVLGRITQDPEQLRIMRSLGYRSAMIVALQARRQTLGAITFATAESGRRYTPADLALAEELARRAGLALDNAHLFVAEQSARTAAEEASRAKDEFLATISHELRTPLTPILTWARMIRRGTLDAAAVNRALETIERNARSQAQLIEDLLDVSRITSGKMRLDVRPIELTGVIETAIETLRPAAEAKGVLIDVGLDRDAAQTSGDPERLQQVVWNLVSNAIKFTPRGGRVRVALERADDHTKLSVADSGKGISPEFLPHVFERFRQADATTTRVHAGLGLGLAIVRHLVELHGGTVHAMSAGEGRGATFTVRLPIIAARPVAERGRRHTHVANDVDAGGYPDLSGLRVLVVDDEPDTCEVVMRLLGHCGADTRCASSAAAALEALETWNADMLVSDIGMPGEDGYMLLRTLRARGPERGGAIPAIALTAYARIEDRLRALSAGFQMHVPKPIEPSELVAIVTSLARGLGKVA